MTVKYLLDTNVISEARKQPHRRDPMVHQWISAVSILDTAISVITLGEVLAGVLRMENKDEIQGSKLREWYTNDLLEGFAGRMLPVTREIVEIEAALHVPNPRPKADALIGATALTHNLILMTRNVTDFDGMGLRLLNPWRSTPGAEHN